MEKENSLSQAPPVFSDNIEKVLLKAALDEKFKEALFLDRKAAFEVSDIPLTDQDKSILECIPVPALMSAISNVFKGFSGKYKSRRNFLKGAAAVLGFAAGAYFGQDYLKFLHLKKMQECLHNKAVIRTLLFNYYRDNSEFFPDSLETLIKSSSNRGNLYMESVLICPVSNKPYIYSASSDKFTLECHNLELHEADTVGNSLFFDLVVPQYQLTAGIR